MNNCYFIYGENEINPMPKHWAVNMSAFARYNKNNFNARLVTLKSCNGAFEDLFRFSKILWAQVMRFYIIHENGGLYSDCDIEFYGPVPSLGGCEHVFAVEMHGHVSDAFFYAKKHSPIIKKALDTALSWSYDQLQNRVAYVKTKDFLDGAGVAMFYNLVSNETGFDFVTNDQIHMSQQEFGGRFHPENGVGIIPFEALCRRSRHNWIGWHQCNGTWRPKNGSDVDMSGDALIKFNL